MYAIFIDGGRQYRVEPGQEVDLDYRDITAGESIEFDKVLAIGGDDGLSLGTPHLGGAKITAEVLGPKQGQKLVVQKFRRRKNSRRKTGHRQLHTRVRISEIVGS